MKTPMPLRKKIKKCQQNSFTSIADILISLNNYVYYFKGFHP